MRRQRRPDNEVPHTKQGHDCLRAFGLEPIAKRLMIADITVVASADFWQPEFGLRDDLASRPWNDAWHARSMVEVLEWYPNRVRMAAGRRINRPAIQMKIGRLGDEKQERLMDYVVIDTVEKPQPFGQGWRGH